MKYVRKKNLLKKIKTVISMIDLHLKNLHFLSLLSDLKIRSRYLCSKQYKNFMKKIK